MSSADEVPGGFEDDPPGLEEVQAKVPEEEGQAECRMSTGEDVGALW